MEGWTHTWFCLSAGGHRICRGNYWAPLATLSSAFIKTCKEEFEAATYGVSLTVSLTMADKAEYQAMKSLNATSVAISHGSMKENK